MKKKIGAIILAMVLLLTGCSWMDGSYVSVTPHQVGPDQTSEATVRTVRSFTELRSALVGMIDSGTERALFSLAEYPREKVPEDLRRAVEYAQGAYPVGAYAVENIEYNFGTGLGSSALSVNITYRRSRAQIEGIRTVRGISDAGKAVEESLNQMDDTLVLQIAGYQEADFAAIGQWIGDVPAYFIQRFVDSGQLLGSGFDAFTDEEMEHLLATVREHVPTAQLRGM